MIRQKGEKVNGKDGNNGEDNDEKAEGLTPGFSFIQLVLQLAKIEILHEGHPLHHSALSMHGTVPSSFQNFVLRRLVHIHVQTICYNR